MAEKDHPAIRFDPSRTGQKYDDYVNRQIADSKPVAEDGTEGLKPVYGHKLLQYDDAPDGYNYESDDADSDQKPNNVILFPSERISISVTIYDSDEGDSVA